MTLQIKAGHYYRRRDGEVVGPAEIRQHSGYPWYIETTTYADNGQWIISREDPFDLVEDLGTEPPTGTDSMYNFNDDKCCQCGSTDLEIVDWKQGHMCVDCCHAAYLESHSTEGLYSEEPIDEPKGAVKHDSGKPDLTLVSRPFMEEVAKCMMFGAKLYGRDNYRQGGFTELRLLAATLRHVTAYVDGEDVASDSNLSHLSHAAATLNMLLDLKAKRLIVDDRFKKEGE